MESLVSMALMCCMRKLPPRLTLAAAVFGLSLYATFGLAEPPPDQRPNGLVRVPNARASVVYMRPGADFSKFRTIELRQLIIPTEVRDAAPPGARTRGFESYVLGDREVSALQEEYDKAMRAQLSRVGYTFVTSTAPDTLIIQSQIIDIRLAAPLERTRRTSTGRGFTLSQGGGTMAIAMAFADGATSQVIAEAADRHFPAGVWGMNNRVANRAEVRRAFNRWASRVADSLSVRKVSSQ